jgi:Domain of unknown function (DUF6458)
MRTATGLALVAIGAILAFAVKTSPSFLNLQAAGWILILTGVAGLLVPRRGYGWLRRRVVVRRPRGEAVEANGAPRRFRDSQWFHRNAIPDPRLPETDVLPTDAPLTGGTVAESPVERTVPGPGQPAEETVEEYFEE